MASISLITKTFSGTRAGGKVVVTATLTGTNTKGVSSNALFSSSTVHEPSSFGYNGVKKIFSWLAGETGDKTIELDIEPGIGNEYLTVTLDDFYPKDTTLGTIKSAEILIYDTDTPYFAPDVAGEYFRTRLVNAAGDTRVNYRNISELGLSPDPWTGSTGGGSPSPSPLPSPSPFPSGLQSIELVSNPGGNVDFVGQRGLTVTGDDVGNTVAFSLPAGTAEGQTLIWNPTTGAWGPGNALPPGTAIGQVPTWNGTAYVPQMPPLTDVQGINGITVTKSGSVAVVGITPGTNLNDVLTWDGTTPVWMPSQKELPDGTVNGDVLTWNASLMKWEPTQWIVDGGSTP